MGPLEPPVGSLPVVRAITVEDIVTVITGVLQHFQPQQIQQQQSLPPPPAVMTHSVGVQSGGVGSSGLPQPSVAIPGRGYGDMRDTICYYCGGQGHLARTCRYARSDARRASLERVTCYHCGQLGHMRRSCPQLRGQLQIGTRGSQQIGAPILQSTQ